MKKVLLIHPWVEDFSAYDFWIKPLGLLTVGTALKQAGIEMGLIDCLDRVALDAPDHRYGSGRIPYIKIPKPGILKKVPRRFKRFGLDDDAFRNHALTFGQPDLILVTCMMTYWYTGAFRAIRIIKEIYPNVPVGLGGNYVTLCPLHAQEFSGADIFFPEKNLEKILNKIQSILELRGPLVNSTSLRRDYSFYSGLKGLPLLTSYGCPYSCSYCVAPRLYPEFLQIRPEEIISEIEENVRTHGVRDFAFFDDALLVNLDWHFHRILEGIIEKDLDLRFHLPNAVHAGSITKKTADLMVQAGFKTIRLGLDSSDPSFQNLSASGKVNNRKFLRGVQSLREAGFSSEELGAYVLYGFPGQRQESVLATLEVVYEAGIRSYLCMFSPVPTTPFFEKAARIEPGMLKEPLLQNKHLCCYQDKSSYRICKEKANGYNHSLDRRLPESKGSDP